ncbi:redoxin domain-containing protein [bacterium]|nr:MAG: redoxin domain-containing protein [bacterium]
MAAALILALLLQAPAQAPAYPPTNTKKDLYGKDLRGKAAPKLEVERWLTGVAPELKGKILILDFWATWCPPCRETIPELNSIAKKFAKDVVVVGISKEDPAVVQAFMKKTPFSYHLAIDTKGRTSEQVGVKGIPHVLIVTPDGIVRWQGFPLDDAEPLKESTVAAIVAASKASAK